MAVQVISLFKIIQIDDKKAVAALQLAAQNAVDDPFRRFFCKNARHLVRGSLSLCFQLLAFFLVDIFAVGEHMHRIVSFRIENISVDPHPEIIAAVFRDPEFILQIIIAGFKMPHHVFDTERRHVAGPVFFQQLFVGHSLQKVLIGQVFGTQRLKIQLGLFTGRPVFSDVQLIDIIIDLLGRFLKQCLPFFQQLRHPHVELPDH